MRRSAVLRYRRLRMAARQPGPAANNNKLLQTAQVRGSFEVVVSPPGMRLSGFRLLMTTHDYARC